MSLFAKDPNLILKESLDFLRNNTSITSVGPGSRMRALVEAYKLQLDEAYTTFDVNAAQMFLYGATGVNLDYLGDIFGLRRFNSQAAQTSAASQSIRYYPSFGTFGDINSAQDITIPKGTRIWTEKDGSNIEFFTLEEILLDKDTSEGFVSVKAAGSGSLYNVASGSITNQSVNIDGLLVTNVGSIENGLDKESDNNFRYRISKQHLTNQNANATAIRLAALAVPGVADVTVLSNEYGFGISGILVKSTTPTVSQALIAEIQLSVDKVKSDGIKVVVSSPDEYLMSFEISIIYKRATSLDERDSVQTGVTKIIADYVNNLDIGETFFINELANFIISSDPLIGSIGVPGKFFNKITVTTDVLNNTITKELIKDWTPGTRQKLILASVNPVSFITG